MDGSLIQYSSYTKFNKGTLGSPFQIIDSRCYYMDSGCYNMDSLVHNVDPQAVIIESPPQIIETEGLIIESPAEKAASSRKFLEELGVELDEEGQIVKRVDDPLRDLFMRIRKMGGKASRAEMEQLILLLCARESYTAEEIAQRLGRTVNYLQQGYLAPLVKSKKLERLKQTKAHPKLRYTTTSKNTDD